MDCGNNFDSIIASSSTTNNIVTTSIPYAYLLGTLKADSSYSTLGSIITYTLALSNSGTTQTTNLNIICTIPSVTSLVTNSFRQDGVILNKVPNSPVLFLYNIDANKTSTITFQLLFNTIPSNNELLTSASISYTYINSKSLNTTTSKSINTNIVTTTFNYINAKLYNIVDRSYINVNSILTYTIPIQFTGTATTNSLILIATIPAGATLVANSLKQDGIILSGSPNPPGITLLNRGLNTLTTISYQVLVESIPPSYKIQHSATASFNYIVNPSKLPITVDVHNIYSNIITTTISNCELIAVHSVNTAYASYGDILTYSISITNIGNSSTNSIVLVNTLPAEAKFISNSLTQDGSLIDDTPANPGALLKNIQPGSTSTVTFKVAITTTLPSTNPLINSCYLSYSYIVDSSITPNIMDFKHVTTNVTYTTITYSILNIENIVDKSYSDVFTTLTYYIPITNIGNATAYSIILMDTIPNNTTFINNSLKQDGVIIDASPLSSGIELNDIGPNVTTTVSFKVLVQTIPSTDIVKNSATTSFIYFTNPLLNMVAKKSSSNSNITYTTILRARLISYNYVNTLYDTIGNFLTFTIPITNTGNTTANHVRFIDTVPHGTIFVADSLTENGITLSGSPEYPGFILAPIAPKETSTVSFKVIISTIPSTNNIKNSATITYDYISDPTTIPRLATISSTNTNITTTTISLATFDTATLICNATTLTSNDIVTFTVSIPNTGNTSALNVILYYTVPDGFVFVDNSVTLNGLSYPGESPLPPSGFFIGTIPACSTYIVEYKFKIN